MRLCYTAIRTILNTSSLLISGGRSEADELMRLYIEEEFSGTTSLGAMNLIKNAKFLLSKTKRSSESHRAVKALFVQSIGQNNAQLNKLGNKRSITRAREDYRSLISHGSLDDRKKKPSGKSHVIDIAISNAIDVIVTSCSTVV